MQTKSALLPGWASVGTEEIEETHVPAHVPANVPAWTPLLNKVVSSKYVPIDERIAFESILDNTVRFNEAAAERVKQVAKSVAWGKAERARITALDIQAERERLAQEAIAAEERDRKRLRRNALQRARRRKRRDSQICVCGKRGCRIGPMQREGGGDEGGDGDED